MTISSETARNARFHAMSDKIRNRVEPRARIAARRLLDQLVVGVGADLGRAEADLNAAAERLNAAKARYTASVEAFDAILDGLAMKEENR